LAIRIAQIIKRNHMLRTYAHRFLKVPDRLLRITLLRRNQPQIVPRIWKSLGIIRTQFRCPLESAARFAPLVLFQVNTAQAIHGLGAGRIVTRSQSK
jgi:hypothetical protein